MTTQTGTTANPFASNVQDFSDSDDNILDNFAEGPDDGTPMGLGGEKGKQTEPASSTLEADIVNGTAPKQPPGEVNPPEDSASEREQVSAPESEERSEEIPEQMHEEPEAPEFPPMLLQMAGYADADAAKADGIPTPEALFAYVRGRGQLLTPTAQPDPVSGKGLYRRTEQPAATTAKPEGDDATFQLPAEKLAMLDDDLVDVIKQMNDHYQQQVASIRAATTGRETVDEEVAFDKAVQELGGPWKDVFGEGDGIELAKNSQRDPTAMTSFNHRALLFEAVQAVREVNAKQGYKPMTLQQEVQWALMQRYPDKFQQAVSGKSNGVPAQRGVTASRPTQRKTPTKSQNTKVLADVDAMLKKRHGYSLSRNNPAEEHYGDI
jgi:hypothetical protein